jgi:signal recognition particle receptor subunit beta
MIHGAYVLRRSDGSILFHKAYASEKLDEVLVSGFLVAVSRFSSELGSGEMDSIIMKNLKFVYGAFEDTMIIFYVDREDDDQFVREDIRKIASQFLWLYGQELKDMKAIETDKFKQFGPELDKIIKEESKIKIVLVGGPKVGKTAIARVFAKETVPAEYEASEFPAIKKMTLDKFEATMWDIPSASMGGRGWEQLIRGAGIAFVVLDSSVESAVKAKALISKIREVAKGIAIFAIANKQDETTAANPSIMERVLSVPTYGFSATSSTARDDLINIVRQSLMMSRKGKIKGDTESAIADELLRLRLELDANRREMKEIKDIIAVVVKKLAQLDKK